MTLKFTLRRITETLHTGATVKLSKENHVSDIRALNIDINVPLIDLICCYANFC